ncbi:MAG TPA: IS66 family transposase [Aggregatilineaceae bacterium]|nr:IS66 family transposase [Aggregatilineaceae bacterium]
MEETLPPPPSDAITPEEWQQTPASVRNWIGEVLAEVKQLRETVEQLQEIVNRNSQNSSQPPSQDRPEQKPAKEPSGPPRKHGGQPGHRGHHRALIDEVDEVVVHRPLCCAGCGALLLGDDPTPYRHQVTELPIVKPKVIEHQVHRLTCPCCGQNNRGELPHEVAHSWFGPNVISLVGLLMGRFRLSKRQVTHLLSECFAIQMAASTVVNQQQVISQVLAAPVAELDPVVKNESVCNIDETSWRQVGAARRSWLWTVVTAHVTLFRIAPSRSGQIARELLGGNYGGVAGTDRCSAYTWLERRQYCWSHLVRDFQQILERGGDSYRVGWYLKLQAEYLLMRWARVRDGTLDYFDFLAEFPAIQAQIRHWLTLGLNTTSSRTAETCRRLLVADPDLWRFASVPGLEPTNNSAERALRHPVIWRRSSHGTQSDLGSRFVERILTVVETCRQQQRPVFGFLRDALIAHRTGQPAPSLLPTR